MLSVSKLDVGYTVPLISCLLSYSMYFCEKPLVVCMCVCKYILFYEHLKFKIKKNYLIKTPYIYKTVNGTLFCLSLSYSQPFFKFTKIRYYPRVSFRFFVRHRLLCHCQLGARKFNEKHITIIILLSFHHSNGPVASFQFFLD